MEVVRTLSVHLLRRGWRATVFLALFAGLAAGLVMAAWSAGRRTATAFDRFEDYAAPPDLVVTLCPPDVVDVGPEELVECFAYDPSSEIDMVRSLPEVDDAGRVAFRGLVARPARDPSRQTLGSAVIVREGGLIGPAGRPGLVAGRWFDATRAEEVLVNEDFVEASGARIGDELDVTFWASDEVGKLPTAIAPLQGPVARVRVVGIVRGLLDLAATSPAADPFGQREIIGGPALYDATPGAGQYGGIAVRSRDGDVDATAAAVQRAFPGRPMNIGPALGADEVEPIREAFDYEARSAEAFAAVAAIAAAAFAAQTVARRSRREWSSLPTLRALGVDARTARATACVRGAGTGVAAGVIGTLAALVLSRFTPVGNARRAEMDPGIKADWFVLSIGVLTTIAVVIVATVLSIGVGQRRVQPARRRQRSRMRNLPVAAVAALGLTNPARSDGRRWPLAAALVGSVIGVASLIAAITTTRSFDRLTRTPIAYGAAWDLALVDASGGAESIGGGVLDLVDVVPGVEAAAGIIGSDVAIGDEVIWVQAHREVGELERIGPVILTGREPQRADEIALGTISMEDLDVDIGDAVTVAPTVTGGTPLPMTVVGSVLVNDASESSPGRGGVVTLEWMTSNNPEASVSPLVVRLRNDTDPIAVAETLERDHQLIVVPPVPHQAILNVEHVRHAPLLLAILVAALASVSLAHMLAASIRRSRGQLSIWRTLGFTSGQVRSAIALRASSLAAVAVVLGVPLGLLAGRVGWRVVADTLGVAGDIVDPTAIALGTTAGSLVVVNLAVVYPGWRESRVSPASALRAE